MSSERAALLERFRASLLSRIERIESVVGADDVAGAATAEALGELHTLKGEARMLGLVPLSELAHALEGRLAHEGGALVALRALDAMRKSLSDTVDEAVADAILEALLLEIGEMPLPQAANETLPQERTPERASQPGVEDAVRGPGRRFVQVDAAAIDELCERLAELSADFGKLKAQTLKVLPGAVTGARIRAEMLENFARVGAELADSTTRAWRLRLVPVEPVLRELRRHARLLATESGKALSVRIEARGVELERNVLDRLWDSLLHLVQNAVDHGIEPESERGDKASAGSLVLTAQAAGPSVVITVEDDGCGIDPTRIRAAALRAGLLRAGAAESDDEVLDLLFSHGFSTREEVSTLSGRGVGLAVVRRQVEGLGGDVRVSSTLGAGTSFVLRVPFTITKERSLVVAVGEALFGFAARTVRAVLGAHELPNGQDTRRPVLRHGGETIPVISLASALELTSSRPDTAAIVLEVFGKRYALGVSEVVGDSELIRRPADALLGTLTGIAATALLDDGRLAFMLDLPFLQRALRESSGRTVTPSEPVRGPRRRRVLVADDSPVVCQLVQEILVSAGYVVEVVNDGLAALAAIRVREPDLVLSDVEMPNMGGLELLAEIRQRTQKLPVVMLTTRGTVEDRQRASALGANAYLLKTGFKSDALLDVVLRFLPPSSHQNRAEKSTDAG